jgi:branched-chain amino acid transport system ATP-binding protein
VTSTAAEATTPVLEARDLVVGYIPGVDILKRCSIAVGRGELVGIIGPNGAGKSTLVKAVFGLVPVRDGAVVLEGEEITSRSAHELVAAGLGYVPQVNNVFPSLTISENLEMGSYVKPKRFRERFGVVAELFPLLGQRRNQSAGALSGGERQMLAMARALMTDPQILLLDEPSAGLSPLFQGEVFQRVREINSTGVSVLMVEQNAHRCLQICDRAYVLDQGQNAYTGSGTDLLHDPKVIELYLGTLAKAR